MGIRIPEKTELGKGHQERGKTTTQHWQRVVLSVCHATARYVQRLPRAKAMRFGGRLGVFLYGLSRQVFPRPHRYARRNLRLTQFPEPNMTERAQDAFIRRVFIQFSKGLIDFLRGPVLTSEELEGLVRAEGFEYVEAALQAGKGIIFVTAHLGNWEMLARWLVAHGVALTVVAREPEDPEFAAYIHRLRENAGFSVVYRGSSVRELLALLRANKAVGLLPDQNSGDLFVPFFGVPAGTVSGPAALALHTGAALIPTFCVRLPDDTYRLTILPPLATFGTGDKAADIERIMRNINEALESVIREYPDQWLWLHNRWKGAFEEGNRERAFPDGIPDEVRNRWHDEEVAR